MKKPWKDAGNNIRRKTFGFTVKSSNHASEYSYNFLEHNNVYFSLCALKLSPHILLDAFFWKGRMAKCHCTC